MAKERSLLEGLTCGVQGPYKIVPDLQAMAVMTEPPVVQSKNFVCHVYLVLVKPSDFILIVFMISSVLQRPVNHMWE